MIKSTGDSRPLSSSQDQPVNWIALAGLARPQLQAARAHWDRFGRGLVPSGRRGSGSDGGGASWPDDGGRRGRLRGADARTHTLTHTYARPHARASRRLGGGSRGGTGRSYLVGRVDPLLCCDRGPATSSLPRALPSPRPLGRASGEGFPHYLLVGAPGGTGGARSSASGDADADRS